MQKNNHERIDDLEFLRAVAIIFTLIAHSQVFFPWDSPLRQWLSSHAVFWDGVDLFFCISGFVITRSLVQQRLTVRVTIAFWVRRAFRIWPSAWFWLATGVFLSAFVNKFGSFGAMPNNVHDAIFAVANLYNVRLWFCFEGKVACGFNPVYWSLSLEEQFYILLPVLAWASGKRLLIACAALWLLAVLIPRPLPGFLWLIRADCILAGVMLALVGRTFTLNRNFARFAVTALVAFLFLGPGFSLTGKAPAFPGATQVVSIACVLLVAIASSNTGLLQGVAGLRRVIMWVGTRSYALYLVHYPIASLVCELWRMALHGHSMGPSIGVPLGLTEAALIAICAEFNYRVIENPLRAVGKQLSRSITTYRLGVLDEQIRIESGLPMLRRQSLSAPSDKTPIPQKVAPPPSSAEGRSYPMQ
jgi:peptidoglycan/LPS O-acetylase OafA/YrhL